MKASIYPDDVETSDAVDRDASRSLAKLFGQLASGTYKVGYHIHFDWDESDAPAGFRIGLSESGCYIERFRLSDIHFNN